MDEYATITIPRVINNVGLFSLSRELRRMPNAKKYILDFGSPQKVHPFATLTLCMMLKQFFEKKALARTEEYVDYCVTIGITNNDEGYHKILRETGAFDMLDGQCNVGIDELALCQNHIPITYISVPLVQNNASSRGVPVGNILQSCADIFASLIAKVFPDAEEDFFQDRVFSFLSFCIRVMLRNSVEHGQCDGVYVSGNCYPKLKVAEIAIVDQGIGVYKSLKYLHAVHNESEAIRLALQPGLSGKATVETVAKDTSDWSNSGYGLYLTSSLCTFNSSSCFTLLSNGRGYRLQNGKLYAYNIDFLGTAVCMNIHFEDDLYYENLFEKILTDGEKLAAQKGYISKASSSSKLFERKMSKSLTS